LNGDETIAKGKTDAKGRGYWETTTGRVLVGFDTMKDTPYRLHVAGTADATLNAARPISGSASTRAATKVPLLLPRFTQWSRLRWLASAAPCCYWLSS